MTRHRKKINRNEIIRFIITGLIAAIIDFAFCTLASFLLQMVGMNEEDIWCIAISTAVGFIISVIFNYILSIRWVYQNFDKNKMKKNQAKHATIFIVLSAVGLLIGVGIMTLLKFIFIETINVNIDGWQYIEEIAFTEWIGTTLKSKTFWLYAFAFVVKTLIVLVFNYVTRKKILFVEKNK